MLGDDELVCSECGAKADRGSASCRECGCGRGARQIELERHDDEFERTAGVSAAVRPEGVPARVHEGIPKVPSQPASEKGRVYFIGPARGDAPVKIGFTSRAVESRL